MARSACRKKHCVLGGVVDRFEVVDFFRLLGACVGRRKQASMNQRAYIGESQFFTLPSIIKSLLRGARVGAQYSGGRGEFDANWRDTGWERGGCRTRTGGRSSKRNGASCPELKVMLLVMYCIVGRAYWGVCNVPGMYAACWRGRNIGTSHWCATLKLRNSEKYTRRP